VEPKQLEEDFTRIECIKVEVTTRSLGDQKVSFTLCREYAYPSAFNNYLNAGENK